VQFFSNKNDEPLFIIILLEKNLTRNEMQSQCNPFLKENDERSPAKNKGWLAIKINKGD
jgi:hypothetical protein